MSSRRYSSFQGMFNAGGRNSINSFASSYSRSANFIQADFDVPRPKRPSMVSMPADEETALLEDTESIESGDSIRTLVLKGTGNSTAPQTMFNGINTLVGIGILSLPLGMSYAGWVPGTLILTLCAISTQYTARLLAKCLDKDDELMTYGDIAQYSFGHIAHVVVIATFTIDLLSAGVSMIIIFADSFNALTGVDKLVFKVVIAVCFFLSSFVRLDILSHLSLMGIVCTSLIVVLVIVCGLLKQHQPGSLIDYAPTSLWPQSSQKLFLSLGIFMSPFGGHAIFPELYRDMKHPYKFPKACASIFGFTFSMDFAMAALGFLMFGSLVADEVTKSIMITKGFPQWVNLTLCALMGVLPVSKGPLVTRPLVTMLDQWTGTGKGVKFLNRLAIVLVFFLSSLLFTNFGRIISFLGSAICFTVCIIYPISFYLKIHWAELPAVHAAFLLAAIAVSVVLATVGTLAVAMA